MANADVLVLNLGADGQFQLAVDHVSSVIRTMTRTSPTTRIAVETPRSRARIAQVLADPIGLLHVMAHGTANGELHTGHRPLRRHKAYTVGDLEAWVELSEQSLRVDGVLLDACHTYSHAWRVGVAAVIAPGRPAVLIGTTRSVGWDEASTYVGAFYAALLRHHLPSQSARRRSAFLDAHRRAAHSYRTLLDTPAPFKATQIGR